MASENFNSAYALTLNPSTFTFKIASDDGTTSGQALPAAANVTFDDPGGTLLQAGHTYSVTDIGFDYSTYTNRDVFNTGSYKFIETATLGTANGIVVQEVSTSQFFFLTNSDDLTTGNTLTRGSFDAPVCFLAGTMIRILDGEVPVETLKCGDFVLTSDGRSVAVDWLGIQTVSLVFADKMRVLPIRIRAGALSENAPARDLLVSPDHALLVDGALIQAGALINGTSIVRETDVPTTFKYYHVEVADHSLILAENTPAETFVDNVDRLAFDNWAEHEALYPNGKPITELPYPRAKSHRQVPVSTRVMLAARAEAIGAVAAAVA
jgi:hypothetical protein